jgi:AraC family transcriptional regulator
MCGKIDIVTGQGGGGDTDWGALLFDSQRVGWHSLEVRRWRQYAQVDTTLPADDGQLVTTLLSGWKRVDVRHGPRWDRAVVGPGTFSATPPGQPTKLRWRSGSPLPLDHLSVRLSATTMHRLAEEMRRQRGRPARLPDRLAALDPLLPGLMSAMLRAARTGEADLYAASAGEFLAVHLLVKHAGAVLPQPPRREVARVRRIESLLHDRIAEPILLGELAEVSGLSRSHLIRVFRDATGETPNRYLTRIRMESARRLLEATDLSVAEVSRRNGYASTSQFSRAFRRETGKTPREYRGDQR